MRRKLIYSLSILALFLFLESVAFTQGADQSDQELDEELDNLTRPQPNMPNRPPLPSSRQSGGTQAGKINLKTSGGGNGEPLLVESFDFQDANIEDVVKAISKLTNKNFILDKNVTGKITILANSPITVDEAYRAFLSALNANGLTTVQAGKFTKIISLRTAKQSGIETYAGDYTPTSDQIITRIYRLKNINAQELATSLRDLAPPGGIVPYIATNSLIITDTGSNISRLINIIKDVDIQGFKEQLEVIPVKYASASEIAEILNQLYQTGGTASRFPRPMLPSGSVVGSAPSKIIADDRTNSLIILGNQETLNNIKSLIAKIDFDVAGGGKIHVYYLQFADAEQLAQTLSNLASGTASDSARKNQAANRAQIQPTSNTQVTAGSAVAELSGGVKITADKATNSLVITASPQDYEALKIVIQKLDISRKQVYLEASIIELSDDINGSFGVSYTGGVPTSSNGGGVFGAFRTASVDSMALFLSAITGVTSAAPHGGQVGWVDGHTSTINFAGTSVTIPFGTALIQTLVTEANANLLSAPRILVLDNEEAKIKVGSKEPVSASSAITGTGIGQQSIDRIPVLLELKITPQINEASDFVKLKVSQSIEANSGEVEFPTGNGGIAKSIKTTERAVDSTVVIKNKDTAILGGLMQDNIIKGEAKIPILGDIPLLGWLFKVATTTTKKTNLVLFLTPTIIHRNIDFRNLFDDTMHERQQFIDRNSMGTENKDWYINRNLKPPKLE